MLKYNNILKVLIFLKIMEISKEEFENIANLSALSPGKVNQNLKSDLEKIISRFESLKQIDTNGIDPTAHVTNLENSLREDESAQELDNDSILHNAPETTCSVASQISPPCSASSSSVTSPVSGVSSNLSISILPTQQPLLSSSSGRSLVNGTV